MCTPSRARSKRAIALLWPGIEGKNQAAEVLTLYCLVPTVHQCPNARCQRGQLNLVIILFAADVVGPHRCEKDRDPVLGDSAPCPHNVLQNGQGL